MTYPEHNPLLASPVFTAIAMSKPAASRPLIILVMLSIALTAYGIGSHGGRSSRSLADRLLSFKLFCDKCISIVEEVKERIRGAIETTKGQLITDLKVAVEPSHGHYCLVLTIVQSACNDNSVPSLFCDFAVNKVVDRVYMYLMEHHGKLNSTAVCSKVC